MKSWILAIVLALFAIAPFLYLAYHMHDTRAPVRAERPSLAIVEFQPQIQPTSLEVGSTFVIRAIDVRDGYRFTLNLDGVVDIDAHLPVATKDAAIPVVIDLFNSQTSPFPTATLLRSVDDGDYWIVNIQLTDANGERQSLVTYLRSQDMLLD